jgi:hypothetical protein
MEVLIKHWKYRNLTLVTLGVFLTLLLSRTQVFNQFLIHVGSWGYLGAFFAGMLFVSTFTVTIGALVLFDLANALNPYLLALIAGLGAVAGDLLIFRLVKDKLLSELTDIYNKDFNGKHITRILHTKYFHWMMPVVGAIIIASPLPDEAGITLMGISKISNLKFMLISFLLNSVGIFIAVSFGSF